MSAKRRAQLPTYAIVRRNVLLRDDGCVPCKRAMPCDGLGEIHVHHVAGRSGERLTNERECVSTHLAGHRWAHDNQKQARPLFLAYLANLYGYRDNGEGAA